MEKRELYGKGAAGEKVISGEGDKVPAGCHVLFGNPGDDKSAAQSQIYREVSGGGGGALPPGSDHIRHPGCVGVITGQ